MMTPTVRRLRAAARRGEAALQRFLERHRVPIQGEGLTTFVFVGEADKVDLDHWIYGLTRHRAIRSRPRHDAVAPLG